MNELLEVVSLSGAEFTHTSPTFLESLSGWLINPVVDTLLLMMGFFFLILELLTAGLDIFGIGGLIAVFVAIVLTAASTTLGVTELSNIFSARGL